MSVFSAPLPGAPLYTHPLFQRLTGGAWRPGGVELTRHALSLCGFTPGMRVADVGCGAGATLELLRTAGLRAVGLDLSPPPGQDFSAPVICAHAAHLPLASASLDGLVCECALSLVQNMPDALAGFARVLRPGGALLLSDLFVAGAASAPSDVPAGVPFGAKSCPSCADTALCQHTLESALQACGLRITHFEDHTYLLAPLAAQLLWHGIACAGRADRRLGYGLWIARRTV